MKKIIISIQLMLIFQLSYGQLFTKVASTPFPDIYRGEAKFVDIDNDGDLDVFIVGAQDGSLTSTLVARIYKNTGNGTFGTTPINLDGLSWAGASFYDLNKDGYLDIIYAGRKAPGEGATNASTNRAYIYLNNQGNSFTQVSPDNLQDLSSAALDFGDIFNKGTKDLALTGFTTTNYFRFYNNVNGFLTENNNLTGSTYVAASGGSAEFTDFNKDGLADLAITRTNGAGGLQTYTNNGNGFNTLNNGAANLINSRAKVADFNNDGYPDIFYFGRFSTTSNLLLLNNKNGGFNTAINIGGDNVFAGACAVGDVDNDGDIDIIRTGTQGASASDFKGSVMLNSNGNFSKEQSNIDGLVYGYIDLGDIDNDGDLDMIICGQDGSNAIKTFLYVNNSSTKNQKPAKPRNLQSSYNDGNKELTIRWNSPTDDKTDSLSMRYNVLIIDKDGNLVASPNSNSTSGYNKTPYIQANAFQNKSYLIKNLPNGKYTYKIQAIDQGNLAGEFAEGTFTISVSSVFSVNTINTCINQDVTVTYLGNGTSNDTFNWNFDGAQIISGSGAGPFTIRWNSVGNKTISLEVRSGGITSDPTTRNISVANSLPNNPNNIIADKSRVCEGEAVSINLAVNNIPNATFEWYINNNRILGAIDSSYNLSITPSLTQNYVLKVKAKNGCGESGFSNEFTLQVVPKFEDLQEITICEGDSAIIFGTFRKLANTYEQDYSSTAFCDSIYKVRLIVNPRPQKPIIMVGDKGFTTQFLNGVTYKWYYFGNLIDSANKNTLGLKIGNDGDYEVEVTNSFGCSSKSDVFNIILGSISRNSFLNVEMYPNPANNDITLTNLTGISSLELINQLAQVVYSNSQINSNSITINVNQIPNGLYWIKLDNRVYQKVVIQH
jgi:hypothetical protein